MDFKVGTGRWGIIAYPLDCAMHGAINIRTPWGFLCFKCTTRGSFGISPWYIYWSPNATPWASTFAFGPGVDKRDKRMARIRRTLFGAKGDGRVSGSVNDAIELMLGEVDGLTSEVE